jgi:hypothetical protein
MMPSKETRDPPSLNHRKERKAPAIPRLYLKTIIDKGEIAAFPLESPDDHACHREERSGAAISSYSSRCLFPET